MFSAAAISPDPISHHIADLVTIGLYLCLWYCKYMKCTGHIQTVKFRPLVDFVFFVRDFLFSRYAPANHFPYSIQIVITLDNKKNSVCSETVFHFYSESVTACPFKAGTGIFF